MAVDFLKDITIGGTTFNTWRFPTNVTDMASSSTPRSIANNTFTDITMWTAPKDCLVIAACSASFAANATGLRSFQVFQNTSGLACGLQFASPNTGNATFCGTIVTRMRQGDKLNLKVMQRSGGALNLMNYYLLGFIIDIPE